MAVWFITKEEGQEIRELRIYSVETEHEIAGTDFVHLNITLMSFLLCEIQNNQRGEKKLIVLFYCFQSLF